jgi:hypothetical protein
MSMPLIAARRALDDRLSYASRSRLAPFVKLAGTIRHYRASIEATIEWKLTNGISESNNAAIGRIRLAARGFHDPESFITMISGTEPASLLNCCGQLPHDPRDRQKTRKNAVQPPSRTLWNKASSQT